MIDTRESDGEVVLVTVDSIVIEIGNADAEESSDQRKFQSILRILATSSLGL